jgi:magnesium-transporting ATPase (P-type)
VGEAELTDAARGAMERRRSTMASQALRVLAIAMRTDATPANAEHGMTFLGWSA